ncbi:hypothetical protein GCAAIG_08865 [Candidatus Electronema halotolerans]
MYLKFSTVKDTIDKLKKLYLKFFEVPLTSGERHKRDIALFPPKS